MGDIFANFGTNIKEGLQVTAIGMIVVFIGLIILIALVKIMTTIGDRRAAKKVVTVPAPAPVAPAPIPVEDVIEAAEEAAAEDESEIIAAIMSAISIMYEGTGKRPVVRAVRRSSKGWGKAYNN